MIFEIVVILLLIVANGVFAMAEMAVIASRRARLLQRAAKGDLGAAVAAELSQAPGRFLATIQFGITMIGVLAGAFGGVTIAKRLSLVFAGFPRIAHYADALGMAVVVVSLTFLSLVIGELVPKRIALAYSERIASLVAIPMRALSVAASPIVRLLGFFTDAALRLLGVRPSTEPSVTEEEIRIMMEQGTRDGVFQTAEHELVSGVFRFADRKVGSLMTPRTEISWLDLEESPDENRRRVVEGYHTAFPVCRGALDNVAGVVTLKEIWAGKESEAPFDLASAMTEAMVVPEGMTAVKLLERFRDTGKHFSLVIDEHGGIQGLVTPFDILEAIVGGLPTPEDGTEPDAVRRADGSWLLDGMMPIDRFRDLLGIEHLPGEEGDYQTLAGFAVMQFGRIPAAGDRFTWMGYAFEIVDMDDNRIDKVIVTAPPEEAGGESLTEG
jgi:putative hemolysin